MRIKQYRTIEAARRVHYRLLARFGLGASTLRTHDGQITLEVFVTRKEKP